MRRVVPVTLIALVIALIPASKAFAIATVTNVQVFPTKDTKETTQTEKLTATAFDTNGAVVPGANITFRFSVNSQNGNLPGTTGAADINGQRTFSWTTNAVGGDTVDIWNDANANLAKDPGEASAQSLITWVAPGQGTSKLRIDMANNCDGQFSSPFANWDTVGPATPVGTPLHVCAARFSSTDVPTPGPITFTIFSGPTGAHFVDNALRDLGASTAVNAVVNSNDIWVVSNLAGTVVVKAAAEGASVTGSVPFGSSAARIVTISIASGSVAPGSSDEITAKVVDRFGNGVQGVSVTFTESGPGSFSGGISSTVVVTGPNGTATATLFTGPADSGSNTVTVSIGPGVTDCSKLAGDPVGAPAGVCNASTLITVATGGSGFTMTASPVIGVWGTFFVLRGTLTSVGGPIGGRHIQVLGRPGTTGAFSLVTLEVTDDAGRFEVTVRPDRISQYKAVFGGDLSFGPATSNLTTVFVRVGISFKQGQAFVLVGHPATFSGQVSPPRPGGLVFLQEFSGGVWHNVRTTRLDGNSVFRFTFTKTTAGRLLFRAGAPSNGQQIWNVSRNLAETWI